MRELWQKYIERRNANRRKHFEWWSRKRAQGHPRWVITIMLALSGIILINKVINAYYFRGDLDFRELPFEIIGYLIVGLIIGATSWWLHERNYRKFLKNQTNAGSTAK